MSRLPQDEFERFLEDKGLDQAQIEYIETLYTQALTTDDAANWSRARALSWLEAQASEFEVSMQETNANAANAAVAAQDEQQKRVSAAAREAGVAADARRERVRRAGQMTYGMDQGPVADPDTIATSVAVGMWVNDRGDPIDPATGERTDAPVSADAGSVWEMIRGQRFKTGELKSLYGPLPSDEQVGASGVFKAIHSRRFFTPSQAMALLGSLEENSVLDLQRGLWEAGLFNEGTRPDWGLADGATRAAFINLFQKASLTPDIPLDQVLQRLATTNIANLEQIPGAPGSTDPADQAPPFAPEVASPETLSSLIDDISQELFGSNIDPERKQALIQRLQAGEIGAQRQQYDQDLATARAAPQQGGPAGMEEIDTFMAAISGQESGGNYTATNPDSGAYGRFQIMPANWAPWATRAGLGPNAPRTPENQEIVARRIMMDYFAQFGNWRDVAVAWYSGAGNMAAKRNSTRSQGAYPSIAAYADQIMDRMASLAGTVGAQTGPQDPGAYAPIERFDPAAEAEAMMRAQDPQGWAAHEFGQRAQEFFSLLGGVT